VNGKTVLLVDDDHSILSFAASAIFEAGHQAIFNSSGNEVIQTVRDQRPELIVIEINISKADGWNLCSNIRAMPEGKGVPIILTSRIHSQAEHLKRIVDEQGANGYLMKPFGIDDLMRVVHEHLGEGTAVGEESPGPLPAIDPEGIQGLLQGAMLEIPCANQLRKCPPSVVLGELRAARRTGLLYVGDVSEKIVIYLEQGRPVCARSTVPYYRLGEILLDSDKITKAQYNHAREMVLHFGGSRWLEEILLGLGHIEPQELQEALFLQLHGLLTYAVNRADKGTCFIKCDIPLPEEVRIELSLGPMLFHATKAIHDRQRLASSFPDEDAVLTPTPEAGKIARSLALDSYEEELLGLADGSRTFSEICTIGRQTMGNVEALLLAFLGAGLVEINRPVPRPGGGKPPAAEAHAPPSSVISGDLGRRPFAPLLTELHLDRKTGVLVVQYDGARKWIYLLDGEIVFARSSLHEDRIGRVLVEAGLVPEADVEKAATESGPDKGRRIGGVLVERGLVTFEQIYWAGIFQVQNIVQSLFTWHSGQYAFRERELPPQAKLSLPLSTTEIILEGMRACPLDALEAYKSLPDAIRFRRSPDADQRADSVKLSDLEEALLSWVTEGNTLAEIFEVEMGDDDDVRRAAHALLAVGLLQAAPPRKALRPRLGAPRAPAPASPPSAQGADPGSPPRAASPSGSEDRSGA